MRSRATMAILFTALPVMLAACGAIHDVSIHGHVETDHPEIVFIHVVEEDGTTRLDSGIISGLDLSMGLLVDDAGDFDLEVKAFEKSTDIGVLAIWDLDTDETCDDGELWALHVIERDDSEDYEVELAEPDPVTMGNCPTIE